MRTRSRAARTPHAQGTSGSSRTAAAQADRRSGSPRPGAVRGRRTGRSRGGGGARARSTPHTTAEIAALFQRVQDLQDAATEREARIDALQDEVENREGAVQQLQMQHDDAVGRGTGDPGAEDFEEDSEVIVTNTTSPPPAAGLSRTPAVVPSAQQLLVRDKAVMRVWKNPAFSKKWVLIAHQPPGGAVSLFDMRTILRAWPTSPRGSVTC